MWRNNLMTKLWRKGILKEGALKLGLDAMRLFVFDGMPIGRDCGVKIQSSNNHGLHSNKHRHLIKSNRCVNKAQELMANANRDAGISLKSLHHILAMYAV
ncbi:unnamed protein product [Linum trigynum]|uniref:Uncharacterized protein n=1 Tax=Linum trigynum TaxID=586398 RepID=A0AAV2CLN6_9ROSI